jgi:hypothetical protein
VTVNFAGFEEMIPGRSFVRKGHKWSYKGPRRGGIRKIELHDDGRFKIQATDLDLRGDDFDSRYPVDFSLSLGPDIGEVSIQLDRKLKFRSRRGGDHDDDHGDDDHGDDDDDDDDDDHDDDGNKDRLRNFLKRWFKGRGR